MDPISDKADLQLAIAAIQKANERLQKCSRDEMEVRQISGREWKLKLDKILEDVVLEILIAGSRWGVLAEESGFHPRNRQRVWVVDPLDGSVNFSRGIPLSAISIGLWEEATPILGAVFDISSGSLYSGIVGIGAWRDQVEFTCPKPITLDPSRGIFGTGLPASLDHSPSNILEVIEASRSFGKTRMLGSATMSLIYVATGKIDSYFERRIALWDVGAAVAIVQAAGGVCVLGAVDDEFRLDVQAASCPELLAKSVKVKTKMDQTSHSL